MIYLQEIGLERMSLQDLHYAMKMLAPEFIAFIAGIFFLVKYLNFLFIYFIFNELLSN